MIASELYLAGIRKDTGEYEEGVDSCQQCKKIIINAGIERVIIRTNKNEYKVIEIEKWIQNDDLLERKNYLLEREKNVETYSGNSWKTKCAGNQLFLTT